jgi:hypothetical protein
MFADFCPVRADCLNGIHHQHQRIMGVAAESTDVGFGLCFLVFFVARNDGFLGVIIGDGVNSQYASLRK